MSRHHISQEYTQVNDISDLEDNDPFEVDAPPPRESFDDIEHERETKSTAGRNNCFQRFAANFSFRALAALILWYLFSICSSVYNKYMFSGDGMDFQFPILTTSLHQLVQVALASIALTIKRSPFHGFPGGHKVKAVATLASSGDIGLGNASSQLVTSSFYTMIKSSASGFVLVFSALFGLEEVSWRLAAIITIMTIGVSMMVFGETNFNIVGFLCVLGASCCSGLRWAATKSLLNNNSSESHHGTGKIAHPLHAIIAIAPGMFVCLLLWGLALEGPKKFFQAPLWSNRPVIYNIGISIFPGFLAFFMIWAEFELLNLTGPSTLAVAGICKEVATICVSLLVFQDKLTLVNVLGIIVTVAAIALYHYHRINT